MKKNLFNAGILVLSLVVLLLSATGCKSKQKLAQEQAAAAYAQQVEQAKQDLLAIINDRGSMTLEEKENRLNAIKAQNFTDAEVRALIDRAEDVLAKLRQRLAEEQARDAQTERENKQTQLHNEIKSHFRSVASATSFAQANRSIANALELFASEDIPLLIIISIENGMKDYDRPTTIRKYLEYLKDVRKFDKEIETVVVDKNGKITEIELIKK
tara:strand:- start:177 stop:818 length:642 start_codon:yes stop_codon:yes gene_type:complete